MATVSGADTFLFAYQTYLHETEECFPKGSANMLGMPGYSHWLPTRQPHTEALYIPRSIDKLSLLATGDATVPLNAYHFGDQQSPQRGKSWKPNCQLPVQSTNVFGQMTLLGIGSNFTAQGWNSPTLKWHQTYELTSQLLFAVVLYPSSLRKEYLKPMQRTTFFWPFISFQKSRKLHLFTCKVVCTDTESVEQLWWAGFCRN